MIKFGIEKKILDKDLVSELIKIESIGAYLIREKRHPMSIEGLKKILSKDMIEKIELLKPQEKTKIRNSFFVLRSQIFDFPLQALINTLNNKERLNHKICSFDHNVLLRDIEFKIRKNTLKKSHKEFTTADTNNLRKSILILNSILAEGLRPMNNLCINQGLMDDLACLKETKSIKNNLITLAKRNKKKLRHYLDFLSDDIDPKDMIGFLSSLSLDITPLWSGLHPKKKDYLYSNFSLYKNMKFENFTWTKRKSLPSFAMLTWENSDGRKIKTIEPFFKKRFFRVQNMAFLDEKFRVITEQRDSILDNLDIFHRNFS